MWFFKEVSVARYQPSGSCGRMECYLLASVARCTSLPLSQPHATCFETGERWEAQLRKHDAVQILKLALKM